MISRIRILLLIAILAVVGGCGPRAMERPVQMYSAVETEMFEGTADGEWGEVALPSLVVTTEQTESTLIVLFVSEILGPIVPVEENPLDSRDVISEALKLRIKVDGGLAAPDSTQLLGRDGTPEFETRGWNRSGPWLWAR